LFNKPT